ncbi:phosphate signaling complex protein PhoU [Bifidobacterium choloepi]|uniref:Phosphate-specific transport system accessory protein PhoU n=1 Tax=Bifidobacterium choloepi TaxID=2614131 RepID=A0A6I5NAW0_9BIFI|nr:phosphate signaling complex protein PhoU [Bifidobacterium choloepi]NEG69580.1 phosphate signaling complex protein PhoU [Bifidobacterium choloepi]
MRVIFNEEMQAVADDLDHMARNVRDAIHGAGQALTRQDLDAAQTVIDGDAETDALANSVIDQCVVLLSRQNPVATDLRVVVASLRLAATFERMGDLARHIAETARRTYPESPLPPEAIDMFQQMQDFLDVTADRLVTMLADRDTNVAEQIIADDDKLDELHRRTFALAQSPEWSGTNQQLIDVVLLGRFMERLGDHAVSASRRVVYIVSGFDPSKEPARDEGTDID